VFYKDKAHPLQAMQAQRGLGELTLLDFSTTALYGGRLSASRTGRFYPQGHPWYSWPWYPRAMVYSEGNMSQKTPVTRPGINPGTFRLVAQRLNHYATPGPTVFYTMTNLISVWIKCQWGLHCLEINYG
jgi:hypothetical protein